MGMAIGAHSDHQRRQPRERDRPDAAGRAATKDANPMTRDGQPERVRRDHRAPTSASWSPERRPIAASTRRTARSCSPPARPSTPTHNGRSNAAKSWPTRARSSTGTPSPLIAASPPASSPGKAVHYCARDSHHPGEHRAAGGGHPERRVRVQRRRHGALAAPTSGPASPCSTTTLSVHRPQTPSRSTQQMTVLAVELLRYAGSSATATASRTPRTTARHRQRRPGRRRRRRDRRRVRPHSARHHPPTIVVPRSDHRRRDRPGRRDRRLHGHRDRRPRPGAHASSARRPPAACSRSATPGPCIATDYGGNTASASFVVTVLGANEQPQRLIGDVIHATTLPAAVKTQLIAHVALAPRASTRRPPAAQGRLPRAEAFTTVVRFVAPPTQAADGPREPRTASGRCSPARPDRCHHVGTGRPERTPLRASQRRDRCVTEGAVRLSLPHGRLRRGPSASRSLPRNTFTVG